MEQHRLVTAVGTADGLVDKENIACPVGSVTGQTIHRPVAVLGARVLARVGRQGVAVDTQLRTVGATQQEPAAGRLATQVVDPESRVNPRQVARRVRHLDAEVVVIVAQGGGVDIDFVDRAPGSAGVVRVDGHHGR